MKKIGHIALFLILAGYMLTLMPPVQQLLSHTDVNRLSSYLAAQLLDPASDPGPIAHFSFDDGDAQDMSGNANDGTAVYEPVFSTDGCQNDGCVLFDGVNDRVQVNNTLANFGSNDFTISAWLKREDNPGAGGQDVLSVRTAGQAQGWIIYASRSCPAGQLSFYATSDGVTWDIAQTFSFPGTFDCGQWHHFSITRSGSTFSLYTDGISSTGFSSEKSIHNSGLPLVIGSTAVGDAESFKGSVDEVRIYDRALSALEVGALYDQNTPQEEAELEIQPELLADTPIGRLIQAFQALPEEEKTSEARLFLLHEALIELLPTF